MLNLRPYQKKVVSEAYNLIRFRRKRILIFAPTGGGKTIIASRIVADAVSRGKKIVFVVHREILIAQTFAKFQKFGIDCGFIKAGYEENRDAAVQIASVQTLPKRAWWQEYRADLILLDECHLTAFSSVVLEMMARIYPQAIYLGLTATPWRLSATQGLGDIFEDLICAPMPDRLIEAGFLVKPSYYSLDRASLERVGIKNNEFNSKQLAIACNDSQLIEATVRDWLKLAHNRRTIAFTVDVEHAKNLCSAFTERGIAAAYVDGNTPIQTREQIYQSLATGEILVLSSCAALSEGFDVPSVEAILLCRPTQSKALYFQQLGRGLRLSPETDKQDCLILDQAGNVLRHGFIENLSAITLTTGNQKGEAQPPPVKVCPKDIGGCGVILYTFQMICPSCGYKFEREKLVDFLNLTRILSEGDWEKLEIYRAKLKEAYKNSYLPSWAAVVFKDNFGFFPPWDWGKGAIFGEHPTEDDKNQYKKYLALVASRKKKDTEWIERYFNLEFG
ncbi:DEAD/DEAH box helicase [Myxosarcina sp. GI1]|uniref:DEAD/DEAH box helicase n=1 Tax=Myxosarcina sp. GI1 TaxID=1541065 RepID=UPI000564AF2A|nr:DEAD/DEAH box helicase [Myxosarcina sp. GI1]